MNTHKLSILENGHEIIFIECFQEDSYWVSFLGLCVSGNFPLS